MPPEGRRDSAEAIQRRQAQLDRSPAERARLVREAAATFEAFYHSYEAEKLLRAAGPSLPPPGGLWLKTSEERAAPVFIPMPVPDPTAAARAVELETKVRELEARLRAAEAPPTPAPFNPIRITERRKIVVDEDAS